MLTRLATTVLIVLTLGTLAGSLPGHQMLPLASVAVVSAQQPIQQDEFVPIDELPPQDQLPAAPLLVTAYAFVVLALFAYLVSVARRLGAVRRDMDRLESEIRARPDR